MSSDRYKQVMASTKALVCIGDKDVVEGQPVDLTFQKDESEILQITHYELKPAYPNHCPICLGPNISNHRSCFKALWGTERSVKIQSFANEPQNIFKVITLGQSISGAQRKALFHLAQKNILKRSGIPTHILKPEGEFPEMPANEHLTMAIAKILKFNVPAIGLFEVDSIGLIYVIKRFDTNYQQNLMVEDFAQILDELAEHKDRATMEVIAQAMSRYCTSPKLEHADFFRRILFCFLIGNGDMHLKNWSLSFNSQAQTIKLSPIYDFLNVRASFPQERVEMILPLNGKQNDLQKNDFEKFALVALKLSPQFVEATFKELPHWIDVIKACCSISRLTTSRCDAYIKVVTERAQRLI